MMRRKLLLMLVGLASQLMMYAATEITLTSGSYTGTFTQGEAYTIAGQDLTDWYVEPDFFQIRGTELVFRPMTGTFTLTADTDHKYLRMTTDRAYVPETGHGAIRLIGDDNIDRPDYSSVNHEWDNSYAYYVPEISDKTYEATLTIGKELNGGNVNFKFFGGATGWNGEFDGHYRDGADDVQITTESTEFGVGTKTKTDSGNQIDTGNIFKKNGVTLTNGDTYKFKITWTDRKNVLLTIRNLKQLNAVSLNTDGGAIYQYADVPLTATFTNNDGETIDGSDLAALQYTLESGVGSVTSDGVFSSDKAGTAVVKVQGSLGGKTVSNTITLTVQSIPVSPKPTTPGADVIAPYSNSYLKRLNFLNSNIWTSEGTTVSKKTFDSDANNDYAIFDDFKNYVTIAFGGNLNVEGYTHLHVDVFQLSGDEDKTIYLNPQPGSSDTRDNNTKLACKKGEWKSFDIDLSQAPFTDLTSYEQVAFISEAGVSVGESFAIDNVYFWRDQPADPVTVDNDGKGLNWNTTTGTTCYFNKIIWEMYHGTPMQGDAGFVKAHDGNNLTYHTITKEQLNGDEHAQLLLQLTKPIRVSDVELIWANGFPKTYNVYAFEDFPLVNSAIPAELLTKENKLFGFTDHMLATDPYIETVSNLQDSVTHNAQYILIDMTARGEGDTFGYYLSEAHVGAYDEDYHTPDHLGIPDYTILTDVDQTLDVTVRNKRNAILEGVAPDMSSVTTSWTSPQLKKRNNQETVLYATSQGEYKVTVNGKTSTGTTLNAGGGVITVNKNWMDGGSFKSIVQQVYDTYKNSDADLNAHFKASYTENGYKPYYVGDGQEADDNILSRWSTFHNGDSQGDIPWDGTAAAAERRKETNKNQYLLIDLDKVYEVTNVELIWERAYSPEYQVFGFEATKLPSDTDLNKDYATFCSDYAQYQIYKGTNTADSIRMYPLHDEHSTLSKSGALKEDHRTQYLVIKMNEPAQQSNDYFGFSLWEVYAWGADLTITDNVTALSADNLSVKAGHEGELTVKAFGGNKTGDTYEYEEDQWFPVEFAILEPGFFVKKVEVTDDETGTKLERFYIYKGSNQETDATDENLAAIITDNNNGTYGIVAGKLGFGQTQNQYDNGVTDGSANDISFTIKMTSTNTKGENIEGQFELVLYKNAMQLLTDGTSTTKNQVYDDGYFDVNVLKANASPTTSTIDLRNVDFTYSNDGTPLSGNGSESIPAPHKVKSNGGTQLNPNTIYYTDETTLNGDGNLAVKQPDGSWRASVLRIFDGWDWDPIKNDGGLVAGQAYFYTSLKANQYSFIALPFVPTYASLNDKGVKLYKPLAYVPSRKVVQIDEMTEADFASGFEGKPYIVRTENESLYKANGYGIAFKSNGQIAVPYYPSQWKDEATNATITSTYVKKSLHGINDEGDLYLFSSAYEMFLPVGNENLADDHYNSDEITMSTKDVMPFYAYLSLPASVDAGAKVQQVSFFLGQIPAEELQPEEKDDDNGQQQTTPEETEDPSEDITVTGITALVQEGKVTVYDIQGRNVSNVFGTTARSGMYIVKFENGKTRKINIRK